MRSERSVVLAFAVLATLLLSGCTEVGSLVDKAGIDLGLQKLTSQLEEVPTVTSVVSSANITPDYGYAVDVQVAVEALAEQDVLAVVAAVNETFASDAFLRAESLSFRLSALAGAQLTIHYPFETAPDDLDNHLSYWVALTSAYGGPLSMDLWTGSRGIRATGDMPTEPDWTALRAVADRGTGVRNWSLGGIEFSDAFPPTAVLDLRDSLHEVEVGDSGSVELWSYRPGYVEVAFFPNEPGDIENAGTSVDWPQALTAVQLVVDAGIPLAGFLYYSENPAGSGTFQASNIHLGECTFEIKTAEGDNALWEALVASKPDLPEGSGAGYCGGL